MGPINSTMVQTVIGKPRHKVLFLGLFGCGKTTILYRMHLGKVIKTSPTIGFNIEAITHRNMDFHVWDIGDSEKLRPLYHHYFGGTEALVFVVDSCDVSRLMEAKMEFTS